MSFEDIMKMQNNQILAMVQAFSQQRRPERMPVRGSSHAPKFTGEAVELTRFLEDVDRLCIDANVAEAQRPEWAARYADPHIEELWKTLASYTAQRWDLFREEVKALFSVDDDRRYSRQDLEALVSDTNKAGISSKEELGAFARDFMRIAGYLITKGRVGQVEANIMAMQGLGEKLRDAVLNRLQILSPNHHPQDPYPVNNIFAAASFVTEAGSFVTFSGSSRASPSPSVKVKKEVFEASELVGELRALRAQVNALQSQPPRMSGGFPGRMPSGSCNFCGNSGHYMRNCQDLAAAIEQKKAVWANGMVAYLNGAIVRRVGDATLKQMLDQQGTPAPTTPASTPRDAPPHMSTNLFEAAGYAFVQSTNARVEEYTPEDEEVDRLEALLNDARDKAKKGKAKAAEAGPTTRSKAITPTTAPTQVTSGVTPPAVAKAPGSSGTTGGGGGTTHETRAPGDLPQYKYTTPIEDVRIAKAVLDRALEAPVTLSQRELLALSPDIRKQIKDMTTTRRSAVSGAPNVTNLVSSLTCDNPRCGETIIVGAPSLPLRSLSVKLDGRIEVEGVLDQGAQIVAIRKDVWKQLGLPLRSDRALVMESANETKDSTIGEIEHLKVAIGPMTIMLTMQVVEKAPYQLLLGRPFYSLTSCLTRDYPSGEQEITLTDPNNGQELKICTTERIRVENPGVCNTGF